MSARYEPPDATRAPRYTGVRTFARFPFVPESLDGVDVAVHGVPFDTGTSMRAGTRFGPEAIRSVSVMLRPYNPASGTTVFGELSVVDRGDVEVTPQNGERTADGRFSFEEVECLASCGTAPVLQINNGAYHEGLDCEKVRAMLARLAAE